MENGAFYKWLLRVWKREHYEVLLTTCLISLIVEKKKQEKFTPKNKSFALQRKIFVFSRSDTTEETIFVYDLVLSR